MCFAEVGPADQEQVPLGDVTLSEGRLLELVESAASGFEGGLVVVGSDNPLNGAATVDVELEKSADEACNCPGS